MVFQATHSQAGAARAVRVRPGVARVLCAADSAKGVRAKFRQGVACCEQRVFLNFDLTPFALPLASALLAWTQRQAGLIPVHKPNSRNASAPATLYQPSSAAF